MKAILLNRAKIKVSGKKSKLAIKGIAEEHKAFLHNLFTNDINNLPPNKFNYNLRLKGNGHPVNEFFVYNFGDDFILDTPSNPQDVIQEFTKLKLSMQVFFEDLTDNFKHLYIFGEGSQDFIKEKFGFEIQDFEFRQFENGFVAKNFLRAGEEGFDIVADEDTVSSLLEELQTVSEEEFDYIRIKNCIPKIHKELKEGYLPLETPIVPYAISFNKGCYIGQEAIARVYFRGKTPRTIAKFEVVDKTQENTKIVKEGKKLGEVTSVNKELALGYLLRAFIKEGKILDLENGGKVKVLGECEIGKNP